MFSVARGGSPVNDARIVPYADQVYHLEDGRLQRPCPDGEGGGGPRSDPGPGEEEVIPVGQTLDAAPVLPGFTLAVADLFAELDRQG